MCVSSAPDTHVDRPHSMLSVRGQQVGMLHYGSQHTEIIILSGCKKIGSLLQLSCIFGWHSVKFNKVLLCACWDCFYLFFSFFLFHYDIINKTILAKSATPNNSKACTCQHLPTFCIKYINCNKFETINEFTFRPAKYHCLPVEQW